MASPSSLEREVLADALTAAGPDAPTLCQGWTTRDLAAHLVVREGRPDALQGVRGGRLAARSERIRREAAARPYDELVAAFRAGPPALSPFRVLDGVANPVEHAVHAEDVLRAGEDWAPRRPDPRVEVALWRALGLVGRVAAKRSPGGLVLVVPDGPRRHLGGADRPVVLRGRPLELLLWLMGRDARADVAAEGPADVVAGLPAAA